MFALLVSTSGGTQPGSTVIVNLLVPPRPTALRNILTARADTIRFVSGRIWLPYPVPVIYGWPVLCAASFPKPEVAGDRGPGRDRWPPAQAAPSRAARRGLAR